MRILFLSQILPYPLDAGPKIRAYYMLRHLAQAHDVTITCFVRADNLVDEVEHLRRFCEAVHTVPMRRSRTKDGGFLLSSMLTNRSFIIGRDTVPAMQGLVDGLVREAQAAGRPFDAVHSDQLWMAQYALRVAQHAMLPAAADAARPHRIRKVLDQHNAVYLIPRRMATRTHNPLLRLGLGWEARKLMRYEAETCRRFDHVITVTEEDRGVLEAICGERRPPMTAVPICIDPAVSQPVERCPGSHTALHLGTMFWQPNVDGALWLGREVLPLLRQQIPDAGLCIVGKNPPRAVQELASAGGIQVTGYVPEPGPYLRQSAAFTVPVHAGGGMRVKILDGWSWGMPIVSTTVGAEGVDYRDGENILIADDPQAYANALARLMLDRELAEFLAANGRRWVEERYDWRKTYGAVDGIYRKL